LLTAVCKLTNLFTTLFSFDSDAGSHTFVMLNKKTNHIKKMEEKSNERILQRKTIGREQP